MNQYQYIDNEQKTIKHHFLRNFILILIILCLIVFGGTWLKGIIKDKVVSAMSNQVMEKAVESSGVPAQQAEEILNSMSEEDRKTVTNIISDHINSKTLSKAQQYIKDGDLSAAKQFAESELSEEEKNDLKTIARKYADQINSVQQ